MWNNLPQDIRTCNAIESFKKILKINIFKLLFKWSLNPISVNNDWKLLQVIAIILLSF